MQAQNNCLLTLPRPTPAHGSPSRTRCVRQVTVEWVVCREDELRGCGPQRGRLCRARSLSFPAANPIRGFGPGGPEGSRSAPEGFGAIEQMFGVPFVIRYPLIEFPTGLENSASFQNLWKTLPSYPRVLCLRKVAASPRGPPWGLRFSLREIKRKFLVISFLLRISSSEHRFPVAGDSAPDRACRFALACCCTYYRPRPRYRLPGCISLARFLRPFFVDGYGSPHRPGSAAGGRLRRDDSCLVSGSPTPRQYGCRARFVLQLYTNSIFGSPFPGCRSKFVAAAVLQIAADLRKGKGIPG